MEPTKPPLNKKLITIIVGLGILLGLTGFLVYRTVAMPKQTAQTSPEETPPPDLVPLDPAVTVNLTKSKTKDNTVVLSIEGMGGKYAKVSYELSYDSQGIIQGVTSQPLDVSGKDSFVRDDIYLGTCSRNVCRPHLGVKKLSVVLEFTTADGKKSQFSKDYDI